MKLVAEFYWAWVTAWLSNLCLSLVAEYLVCRTQYIGSATFVFFNSLLKPNQFKIILYFLHLLRCFILKCECQQSCTLTVSKCYDLLCPECVAGGKINWKQCVAIFYKFFLFIYFYGCCWDSIACSFSFISNLVFFFYNFCPTKMILNYIWFVFVSS